jgi:hypothetical protein
VRWWVLAIVCGCGRIGFDSLDGGGGSVDAPAAQACPTFAIFCDSFESGDILKWDGSTEVMGTVTPTRSLVHSGAFALDCVGQPDPSNAVAAVNRAIAPKSTGTLAMREWVYAPQPLVNFDGVMQLENTATGEFAIVVGDGQDAWDVSEESSAAGLVDHHTMISTRTEVWMCVELDYIFQPTPTIELYVDETQILTVAAGDPSPTFTGIQAGIGRADTAGERIVVDDVVVASQHIGCN